ncbi:hypothetical protein EMIHUDRAFT_448377 [Emiliania huxleyi CCMP1516]|uniref:Transcription initiation factor IIE subunit alpha N-terminal domain-containing protein n=2 Tax=Emiliania huxleyi TaxID=2903 RepID=A0A0D3IDZ3_EMIH1|nr:hypothetical protein EMIHUDRAFT_448377 [Emiliania huxleyi CCMP1516]EOD09478.1 hypothetical protein EMIHUDRAFT_448377 [Emiliania huxleyi CCMP1516]|eukprot:XP_005761907.1 hypothetical protein EMIHUDRAFT_448377 [Emiliania huxleyi CCMP1516]
MHAQDEDSTEAAFAHVARLTAETFFDLGEAKVMEALIQAPRTANGRRVLAARVQSCRRSPLLQLDEDVAARLHLGTKQVRQFLGRLHADRMVVRVRADGASKAQGADILEQKEGPLAAGDVRCFYGLDYSTLVDVVAYKLDAMERTIEADKRTANEVQLYRCGGCHTTIDSLSVNPWMMSSGSLQCEACGSELSEVDNSVKLREFEQRKEELADLLQLRAALCDVRDAEPPLYKRPLRVDPAASDASDGLVGGAGGSRSVGLGHAAGGGESTLGKSRGPAAAREATSAPPTSEAAAGDGAAGDAQAQAWEERVRAAAATVSESGASGLPMPFSAVTEEDQQRMTSEEFARYEELYAEAVG